MPPTAPSSPLGAMGAVAAGIVVSGDDVADSFPTSFPNSSPWLSFVLLLICSLLELGGGDGADVEVPGDRLNDFCDDDVADDGDVEDDFD